MSNSGEGKFQKDNCRIDPTLSVLYQCIINHPKLSTWITYFSRFLGWAVLSSFSTAAGASATWRPPWTVCPRQLLYPHDCPSTMTFYSHVEWTERMTQEELWTGLATLSKWPFLIVPWTCSQYDSLKVVIFLFTLCLAFSKMSSPSGWGIICNGWYVNYRLRCHSLSFLQCSVNQAGAPIQKCDHQEVWLIGVVGKAFFGTSYYSNQARLEQKVETDTRFGAWWNV
jgi:hypothetical protein